MTTATLNPESGSAPASEATQFANDLRKQTAAVKIKHRKLGVRKALSATQREAAADVFHAERDAITAAKKLLNTRHEAYRKVTGIRRDATSYWKNMTVPYPEPGIRLIRRDRVTKFDQRMSEYRAELHAAVEELQEAYDEMREEARTRLGNLFNEDDYPKNLLAEFGLSWEYPSIDPPAYLKTLNPALYEQEQQRIQGRFDEALRMAEQAFAAELAEMVDHLCDRLRGEDGKPKAFHNSAIEKFTTFFARFGELNVRSNAALDELVKKAQAAIGGATPDQLRKNVTVRDQVSAALNEVREEMDKYLIERPVRLINLEEDGEEN